MNLQEHIDEGEKLYESGNIQDSLKHFDKALEINK